MFIFILSVAVALGFSALCSLLEACLLSYTPSQIARLREKRPRLGKIWQNFKENIERPIAVILIVNTAAHTVGASVAGAKFEEVFISGMGYGNSALIWFTALFTLAMLAFTEILPKTLGVTYNHLVAPVIAAPLAATTKIFSPVLVLVRLMNKPFQPKGSDLPQLSTIEDISALAGLARISRVIGRKEERIIKTASQLRDRTVREVMIPVGEITFMPSNKTLEEAILVAHDDPHTRFPVCRGDDVDDILGYVNFKEIVFNVRTNAPGGTLESIVREVHFADPDESAAPLLQRFVDQHVHIALVRENGKTLGLVTLEDIVEELVGEISDEFDRAPRRFHAMTGNRYLVGGGVAMEELAGRLQVTIPEAKGSVSSWLIEKMGDVPEPGDDCTSDGLHFHVRRVRRNMIFEVAVTKVPAA